MAEELTNLLKIHLKMEDKFDLPWCIQDTESKGRGVFLNRSFKAGEIIFKDTPIVLGPRNKASLKVVCASCLKGGKELYNCSQGCRLPVCSRECELSSKHSLTCSRLRKLQPVKGESYSMNLYRALTVIQCLDADKKQILLLKNLQANPGPQHVLEVKLLKESIMGNLPEEDERLMEISCQVLDATVFEVETSEECSLRGLFPLSGMMNHSCSPNTTFFFSDEGKTMNVAATVPISAGQELTTSYCPLLWPTSARRYYLSVTKHFECYCPRCSDPTEFGTYLSSVECDCGEGKLLPLKPLFMRSPWRCYQCSKTFSAKEMTMTQANITRNEMQNPQNEPEKMSLRRKLQIVWKYKNKHYLLPDLTEDEVNKHEKNIKDVLNLMHNLKLGKTRIRGLLLIELYATLKAKKNSSTESNASNESYTTILQDATEILKDGMDAPKCLREL